MVEVSGLPRCGGGWLTTDFSENLRGVVLKEPEKSSHSGNGMSSVCASCGIEGEC